MAKVSKNSRDPRVLRTRAMLRSALFGLLETQHFDSITVLEITSKAGLNPATFYLHYADKWDLLDSIVGEIGAIIGQHKNLVVELRDGTGELSPLVDLHLVQHIDQYRDFYRLMLGRNGVPQVRHALLQQFRQLVREIVHQLRITPEQIGMPVDLVEQFYASAYVGIIEWWVSSKTRYPPEQIAEWTWRLQSSTDYSEVVAFLRAAHDEPPA
jgi:AcrR family transcriptional regulator